MEVRPELVPLVEVLDDIVDIASRDTIVFVFAVEYRLDFVDSPDLERSLDGIREGCSRRLRV